MQLITATEDGVIAGIPAGFRFLVSDEMELIEAANLYLYYACVFNGRVESLDTQRTYAEAIFDWFQTCEDNAWVWDQVTAHEIAAYRNRMIGEPSPATGRPYSRRTINQRVREVCRFYEWALARRLITELPFKFRDARVVRSLDQNMLSHVNRRGATAPQNLLLLKTKKTRIKALAVAEQRRVLMQLGPDIERPTRNRLLAEAALVTGCRRKEVCALTIYQVPKSSDDEGHLGKILLSVTKGNKGRAVYPPTKFLDRLRWYICVDRARIVAEQRKLHSRRDRKYLEPKEIFLTEDGRPIRREYVSKIFRDAAKAVGLSGATYHSLRHTFAIAMFKQLSRQPDLNPWKALQVLLGHAQLSTTLDIYLEALEIDEAAVADGVEKLYDQALEGFDGPTPSHQP